MFMSTTRFVLIKLAALFAAAVMMLIPAEAFATEGIGLDEVASSSSESVTEEEEPIDYSKLEIQVAMVNGLNEYDYTKESWEAVEQALQKGKDLFDNAEDQKTVNSAVKDIETAVSNLVRMDYSKLENALSEIYDRIGDETVMYDIWSRINDAEKRAKPLLVSGNQKAVDDAAAEIMALINELDTVGTTEKEPEVVIKEVEVEVPPSDDYCNIPVHRTWPVLFFISLALNIAMAFMMVYVFAKRRNTVDNIPLVNYDIDDDMDFEDYDIEDEE